MTYLKIVTLKFFLFISFLLTINFSVYSQCANYTTNYPTGVSYNFDGCWDAISSAMNGGQYAYNSLYTGYIFQWNTAGGNFDTQLTLYNSSTTASYAYNDDYIGTQSLMAYKPTTNETGFVLLSKYNCTASAPSPQCNISVYDSYSQYECDNYYNCYNYYYFVDVYVNGVYQGQASAGYSFSFTAGENDYIETYIYDNNGWGGSYDIYDYNWNVITSQNYDWYGYGVGVNETSPLNWRAIPVTPTISASATNVSPGTAVTLTATNICDNDSYVNVRWGTSSGGGEISSDATAVTVYPSSTTTYYLQYEVLGGGTTGTQYSDVASITICTPMANDNCANAIDIGSSANYTSSVINNSCATDDGPSSSCSGPYKNLWWKVTGVCGTMSAITCTGNTNFDDEIAVFTGSCGSMTEVASDLFSGE